MATIEDAKPEIAKLVARLKDKVAWLSVLVLLQLIINITFATHCYYIHEILK